MATDNPEGFRILAEVQEETKNDEGVHVLNLQMSDRIANWREVNALQRAARIILQPSTREGFGLVVTEALWKGKPVIAADVGAIPLQIRDRDTGLFFRTAASTARKVVDLLKRPSVAEKMGARGRSYVKEHFLLPDRLADFLMTLGMMKTGALERKICSDCIVSFHPWSKIQKRAGSSRSVRKTR